MTRIEQEIREGVKAARKERELINAKGKEVREWCKHNLKPNQGIVETKFAGDLLQGRVFVYSHMGQFVEYRFIRFRDMSIEPLPGLKHIKGYT